MTIKKVGKFVVDVQHQSKHSRLLKRINQIANLLSNEFFCANIAGFVKVIETMLDQEVV